MYACKSDISADFIYLESRPQAIDFNNSGLIMLISPTFEKMQNFISIVAGFLFGGFLKIACSHRERQI